MRRSRSSRLLLAILLGTAPGLAQGQGATESGATFLLLPVGARAVGLGQATVTDRGTGDAAFSNPAGLARLQTSQFLLHVANTFISTNAVLSGYWHDDRVGTLGLGGYVVDLGTQTVTAPGGGGEIGRLTVRNFEVVASYATLVGAGVGFGLSYKLIQLRQDCSGDCRDQATVVGTTHAMDAGLQWSARDDRLQFGLALRHAGFPLQLENKDQADPLPTRLVAGASWTVPVTRLPDGTGLDARFLVNLQESVGRVGDPETLFGAELGYGDLVRLRAGYALVEGEQRGPSIGIGLQFDALTIDFARVFSESGVFEDPAYLTLRVAL